MEYDAIRKAATSEEQIAIRMDVAKFTSCTFRDAGTELYVVGQLTGDDRQNGVSPFGHGDDSTVAVSMLLRIGCQLVSGSADLISDGRHYAGSALVRQLVEVEYLAWAFETKNEEAALWLRSTRDERRNFFAPAKLRSAAGNHFRSLDYSYHCELGGHPVPGSWLLLDDDHVIGQMMLSDCLGHSGRIWNHIVGWAKDYRNGAPVLTRSQKMSERYRLWNETDTLTALPSPPDFPDKW